MAAVTTPALRERPFAHRTATILIATVSCLEPSFQISSANSSKGAWKKKVSDANAGLVDLSARVQTPGTAHRASACGLRMDRTENLLV